MVKNSRMVDVGGEGEADPMLLTRVAVDAALSVRSTPTAALPVRCQQVAGTYEVRAMTQRHHRCARTTHITRNVETDFHQPSAFHTAVTKNALRSQTKG